MPRLLKFYAVCCLAVLLGSCLRLIQGKPQESVTEVGNGPFKILVRSQEFHHSGTVNIDICVAETSSRTFPTKKLQCVLNGYDFDGLSVRWLGQREIEISFSSGRVTNFTNEVLVYRGGSPIPVGFHAILRDENKQYPREYPRY